MSRTVIMGPPGAGKGTQGALLSAVLGVPHITTGGLFRDEVGRGTALGLQVADALHSGRYVDDSLTTAMLRGRLQRDDAADGFVLDGYPRTMEQVAALDELLDEEDREIEAVILLHVEESTLLARLTNRAEDREDDRPEVVRERLARYHELTPPIAQAYEERGLLRRINGAYPVELVVEAVIAAARAVRHPLSMHGEPLR
ncbi:adenylate kinase [Rathayibacter sp. VKM Ac-2760]|uniref:adenylate kinase n=1 Tax=Rathayibacter sp. VKM Ac-2760 TaxID=2609253 RepID=UPI001317DC79|nr:adenylate kinase [Rathayibacter sp. VKM Ac-2760]QHC61077.1 adenylate kinase [Rathayibacter sp. VKM Ac-2760]